MTGTMTRAAVETLAVRALLLADSGDCSAATAVASRAAAELHPFHDSEIYSELIIMAMICLHEERRIGELLHFIDVFVPYFREINDSRQIARLEKLREEAS